MNAIITFKNLEILVFQLLEHANETVSALLNKKSIGNTSEFSIPSVAL